MSAHLVFMGPSTAGKSTLIRGLAEDIDQEYQFTIDRTWTTRKRRMGEDDVENIFTSSEIINKNERQFLFRFSTFPTYEYAIEIPRPLQKREIRMRILMPVFARKFRELVDDPTIFCSVRPFHDNPNEIFRVRDCTASQEDIQARGARFSRDVMEAEEIADISFQNVEGPQLAVSSLRFAVINHLSGMQPRPTLA